MWAMVAAAAVGVVSGIMEGDSIRSEAENQADELEKEGALQRKNIYGEAKERYVNEQLAGGKDYATSKGKRAFSGMSEGSNASQVLAANYQAALRESNDLLQEGDRINAVFKKRAEQTRAVGRDRASKAVLGGLMQGGAKAVEMGYSSSDDASDKDAKSKRQSV